jgi:hypothetical protein
LPTSAFTASCFAESLGVTDRKLAARELANFRAKKLKIDPKLGKLTVEELCDRYSETFAHLSASSVKAKKAILERLKSQWPSATCGRTSARKAPAITDFLVRRWKVPRKAAAFIAIGACGNVRDAFARANNYLIFGDVIERPIRPAASDLENKAQLAIARRTWAG